MDEDNLKIEDNLEEFGLMSDEEAAYWESEAARLRGTDRAVTVELLFAEASRPASFNRDCRQACTFAGVIRCSRGWTRRRSLFLSC